MEQEKKLQGVFARDWIMRRAAKAYNSAGKLAALIALSAMLSLTGADRAWAFANAETQFLPAVQVPAALQLQVSASNFSAASVSVTIKIVNAAGTTVANKTAAVAANSSITLQYTNRNVGAYYSALVEASAAASISSDLQVLASTGEILVVSLPFVETSAAVQHGPGLRLIPGQLGAATVTNISKGAVEATVTVYDNSGDTVFNETAALKAGQTVAYSFSNTGTSNNGYRAVASTSNSSTVVSDAIIFDKTTGNPIGVMASSPN